MKYITQLKHSNILLNSYTPCPIHYSTYTLKYITQLTNSIFCALGEKIPIYLFLLSYLCIFCYTMYKIWIFLKLLDSPIEHRADISAAQRICKGLTKNIHCSNNLKQYWFTKHLVLISIFWKRLNRGYKLQLMWTRNQAFR